MLRFISRRLLLGLIVLAGVSLITFIIARVIPSEPAARWVGAHATAEQIEAAKIELGLDQPLSIQYATYMKGLLTGDWGHSVSTHQPVLDELLTYLPSSLELIFAGMLISLVLGIPLGVISAVKKEAWIDHLSRGFSIGGVSIPTFWLALILQIVFFKWLGWLPLGERVSTDISLLFPIEEKSGSYLLDSLMQGNWEFFTDAFLHLILPAIAMAAYPLGLITRMIRSSMVEVLGEEYMRVMQAYGVPRRKRVFLYALKNAMAPTVTSLGLTIAYSLTSTFLIEAVFNWPGLGMYASKAILSSDYPAIMGITLMVTIAYILINLIVDILLVLLDPRIKLGETV
ncbi:ABC transporter permease [Brevibacillus fluminis]|uniref:ABC transporter permease n=1 Tax=Brevibacillus fluminis TaxID=511487 RepID=A0A3M8D1A9_9BACL|nr:ABC transporter permease [Brevibacillus fluminis]RNB81207.1 ABC transporter permease [Brevibacillus fluminis]